jgi:hypothetical protein
MRIETVKTAHNAVPNIIYLGNLDAQNKTDGYYQL